MPGHYKPREPAPRRDEETCELCYQNRCTQERGGDPFATFDLLNVTSGLVCTCADAPKPCRDASCFYYWRPTRKDKGLEKMGRRDVPTSPTSDVKTEGEQDESRLEAAS